MNNIKRVRNAQIGATTRKILVVKASIQDLMDNINEILSEYYTEKESDEIYDLINEKATEMSNLLDKPLLDSINWNIYCEKSMVI